MKSKRSFANPPNCSVHDCGNTTCQGYWVGLHRITSLEYVEMVSRFFQGREVDPKSYPADWIDFENIPCTSVIRYVADETNVLNNNEVDVHEEPGLTGKYSVGLFRGIIQLFHPHEFHFSKAVDSEGNLTVAFYATNADNVPVYFGDLSSLYP
jgi:hypothetical protein